MQSSKDAAPRVQEARMRNSKFIAEFTKFRLCPYGSFFTMLKVLHSKDPETFAKACDLLFES